MGLRRSSRITSQSSFHYHFHFSWGFLFGLWSRHSSSFSSLCDLKTSSLLAPLSWYLVQKSSSKNGGDAIELHPVERVYNFNTHVRDPVRLPIFEKWIWFFLHRVKFRTTVEIKYERSRQFVDGKSTSGDPNERIGHRNDQLWYSNLSLSVNYRIMTPKKFFDRINAEQTNRRADPIRSNLSPVQMHSL